MGSCQSVSTPPTATTGTGTTSIHAARDACPGVVTTVASRVDAVSTPPLDSISVATASTLSSPAARRITVATALTRSHVGSPARDTPAGVRRLGTSIAAHSHTSVSSLSGMSTVGAAASLRHTAHELARCHSHPESTSVPFEVSSRRGAGQRGRALTLSPRRGADWAGAGGSPSHRSVSSLAHVAGVVVVGARSPSHASRGSTPASPAVGSPSHRLSSLSHSRWAAGGSRRALPYAFYRSAAAAPTATAPLSSSAPTPAPALLSLPIASASSSEGDAGVGARGPVGAGSSSSASEDSGSDSASITDFVELPTAPSTADAAVDGMGGGPPAYSDPSHMEGGAGTADRMPTAGAASSVTTNSSNSSSSRSSSTSSIAGGVVAGGGPAMGGVLRVHAGAGTGGRGGHSTRTWQLEGIYQPRGGAGAGGGRVRYGSSGGGGGDFSGLPLYPHLPRIESRGDDEDVNSALFSSSSFPVASSFSSASSASHATSIRC